MYHMGFPGSSADKESPAMQETPVQFLVGKIPWRRVRLPTPGLLGFPGGSVCKETTCNVGDPGLILGGEDCLDKGMATPSSILFLINLFILISWRLITLQYCSGWRIPMDRGACLAGYSLWCCKEFNTSE